MLYNKRVSIPVSTLSPYLISQVPDSDGPIIAGRDEDIFERMSCQTPDSSLSVSVDHGVGGSILFSNFYDLSIFGSHQDFTLDDRGQKRCQKVLIQ